MDNLRKFNTEADYSSATLNYPSVSWVVSGDTVHYDKSKTMPKVRMAANTGGLSVVEQLYLWYSAATGITSTYFNEIIVDGTSVANPNETSCIYNYTVPTGSYEVYVDYYFDSTSINDLFSYVVGIVEGGGSEAQTIYLLFTSGVTEITSQLPPNTNLVIFEGTTPPTVGYNITQQTTIYVPDDAVNTYKAAWPNDASRIYPRSQCPATFPNL